ncbi:ArsR/SmtB family transcription factor [Vibrio maerlii]|uniref:ArsR/SmtB family transcription factor n=1 Tax=Vibrio maerlii TaxID=2231648 RepID=UPI003B84603B
MTIDEMQDNAIEAADLLKLIAHPERLLVVCQLAKGELGVGELQQLSSLSQSAFSQHLTVLRKHNIIRARKESQHVYYSLSDERVNIIVDSLYRVFCRN